MNHYCRAAMSEAHNDELQGRSQLSVCDYQIADRVLLTTCMLFKTVPRKQVLEKKSTAKKCCKEPSKINLFVSTYHRYHDSVRYVSKLLKRSLCSTILLKLI